MKNSIFYKGLSAIMAVGLFAACSGDYLDVKPVTDVTNSDVTATTEAAALAINGISYAMQTQWGGLQGGLSGSASGETMINQMYAEAMGNDNMAGIPLAMWNAEIVCGGAAWTKENYVMNYLPWKYCYTLIQQANTILAGIDNAEGSDAQRKFIKAQALTFRAHGYTKLMQYYCPRWEDSNNGDFYCAVKRLDGSTGDAPLWKASEVFDQIYNDLNTAVALYGEAGLARSQKWHPDVNVAYGILARAAIIKHDWQTAKDAAHNARQGYPVMDNDTYFKGFVDDNSSIIWTQATDPSSIYYFSFGAHYGVNGNYVKGWGYGAGAISLDLYNQLDPNDLRRQMYLTPDKVPVLVAANRGWNPGKIEDADWWNPDLVVSFPVGMDLSKGPYARNKAINGKWGLYNVALRYCKYYGENIFTGDFSAMSNEGFMAYYTQYENAATGNMTIGSGLSASLSSIPFGAQFKFWSNPPYGTSAYPFMRAAEMALIEAEAAYYLNDEATAISCLMEIQGKRIPGYTCEKTGEALRDEIRLARRIELWGEGFNFTDFKRWNLDIVRRPWVANDPTSGNWMVDYGHNTPAACNHGWRMMIPLAEINYNHGIERSLIVVNDDPNIW